MRRKIFVPLLVSVCKAVFSCCIQGDTATRTVFGDVMEVVAANDNCTGHLGRDDASCENATAD